MQAFVDIVTKYCLYNAAKVTDKNKKTKWFYLYEAYKLAKGKPKMYLVHQEVVLEVVLLDMIRDLRYVS